MANQIFACPPDLLQSLIAAINARADQPLGEVSFHLLGSMKGFDEICIHIDDPRLVFSTGAQGARRTFALLLTSKQNPDPSYQPLPLPDELAGEMIDRLVQALPELPGLEGHQYMELAELCAEAMTAPNRAPLRHKPRAPMAEYEERLRAQALALQERLAPRLDTFDREMKCFRARALCSGLSATIRSLATEGPVIDALNLQRIAPHRYHLASGRAAREKLLACRRRAAADRLTLDAARARSSPYEFGGVMPCSSQAVYIGLARSAGADQCQENGTVYWRTGAPKREPGLPRAVPADTLFRARCELDSAFDRHLLASAHPLVRTALYAAELTRLQPLERNNGRFIELIVAAMIEVETTAPLPVMLTLYRRRKEFRAALSAVVEHRQVEALLATLIDLALDAIEIGDRLVHEIAPLFKSIADALGANGLAPLEAAVAARAVFGTVLVEHDDETPPPERSLAIATAVRQARDDGLIDAIELRGGTVWSPEATRRAVSDRRGDAGQ
jgi:hypothetical protein